MNWNNGDYSWVKAQCPQNIKYWKKNSQMEAFEEANSDVTNFPLKVIEAVESEEAANEACVVFTANDNDGKKWNENLSHGRRIIEDLKIKFTHAKDNAKRVTHEISYIDRKYPGLKKNPELIR